MFNLKKIVDMGYYFTPERAKKMEHYIKKKTNVDVEIDKNCVYETYVPSKLYSKLEYTKQGELFSGWTETVMVVAAKGKIIRDIEVRVNIQYDSSKKNLIEKFIFHFGTEGDCIRES